MKKQQLAPLLTYGGLIPFISLPLIQIILPNVLALDYTQMSLTYGAIIASFISGMHWGVYLFKSCPVNLFIHSNIIALLAWLSVLSAPVIGFLILILCFLYLLYIDKKLYKAEILNAWFWRLRLYVTSIVILTLGLNVLILFL
jgi:hypothetical protein